MFRVHSFPTSFWHIPIMLYSSSYYYAAAPGHSFFLTYVYCTDSLLLTDPHPLTCSVRSTLASLSLACACSSSICISMPYDNMPHDTSQGPQASEFVYQSWSYPAMKGESDFRHHSACSFYTAFMLEFCRYGFPATSQTFVQSLSLRIDWAVGLATQPYRLHAGQKVMRRLTLFVWHWTWAP